MLAQTLTHTLARSHAFRDASLRSEVRRAYAVIGVLVLVAALILTPDSQRGVAADVKAVGIIGVGSLLALQLGVLWHVRWSRRHERGLTTWFLAATVVFESLVPSGIILWHITRGRMPPYAVLTAPPILAYGIMISLTTLRLRPWLCVLAGAISAASYASDLAYVTYGLRIPVPAAGLPSEAYVNTALFIFISGLAAAWVAREIRGHLNAALGEAETRHQIARLEHDLRDARSIQRALLPRASPDIPGFDIAGWNRSADETGGDYYDWQALPDGKWIVTLADVSGHGIGPAMVTAACRAYVRASSAYHSDLGALTSRVNRLLADDLHEGRFVTMASVLIDPRGGPLRLLSAGHGPIVLCINTTGEVRDIEAQDLPLAVIADLDFGPAISIALEPGDVLALVTDGFVEWARPTQDGLREEFGLARLRESFRQHARLPATAMIKAVAADVAAFAQHEPQQDDLTMVVISKRLQPHPLAAG